MKMTVKEAAERRKLNKEKEERLEEICRKNPERFIRDGVIDIPENGLPIYIPDKRTRGSFAHYTHIMYAIEWQHELLPNSIGITQSALESYIDELIENDFVRPQRGIDKPCSTLECVLTLKSENWSKRKSKERLKLMRQVFKDVAPNGLIKPVSISISL